MKHEVKQQPQSGIRISLQVPSQDPDLYKNKATNDILLFLSRHRFDEFSVSEIATQTGNTKPTVGRAVDVLRSNDLVVEEPEGNQRLVRINRDRLSVPDDPILQIPQSEFHKPVKAAVDELTEAIENTLGILLYGSVARGEADRRSDIDLWVLVSEDRAAGQRAANGVARELEEREFESGRYAYDIDVEDVSSIPMYTEDIREIVLSGIPVHKKSDFETVERLLMNEVDRDE
jgi:predicted nucleotidyltransferase